MRKLVFKVSSTEELEKLVEVISESVTVKGVEVYLETKTNTVCVYIYGPKDLAKQAEAQILQAVKAYRGQTRKDYRGLYHYDILQVLDKLNLKVAIPLDLLVEVLKLKGYRAELRKGILYTDASLDELGKVAKRIADAYYALRYSELTTQAKKAVALAAALLDVDESRVEELANNLLKEGLLKTFELPDGRVRIIPSMHWEEVFKRVVEYAKSKGARFQPKDTKQG